MSNLTGRTIADHSSRETPAGVVFAGERPPSPAEGEGSATVFQFRGASLLGVFASIAAALLALAASTKVSSVAFVPKFAIALLFAAVGLVPMARLVRSRSPIRWATGAAIAFLVVAFVSAARSPSPNIGFFGLYLWGTGWLLWLAAAGAFAIGASLGPVDRPWLFGGLLVGALGNALVAVWQVVAQPASVGLGLYDGTQADGLLGNPIFLEALLLGGLALVLGRTCRSKSLAQWALWGSAVVLMSVALEFSAERLALPVVALLIGYAIFSYRMRGVAYSSLLATGYAMAYLSGSSNVGTRVASGTSESTTGLRLQIWERGFEYAIRHPTLGIGPGQLRTALDSTATLAFTRHLQSGRALTDAHDVLVEVAVTTGLIGLGLFVTWLASAAQVSQRGAFFGFAVAMLAVELVDPLNVAILPLMLLALGAATACKSRPDGLARAVTASDSDRPSGKHPRHVAASLVTAVAVLAALGLGGTMVVGDTQLLAATHNQVGAPFDLQPAENANALLPYWPESALGIAQVTAYQALASGLVPRSGLLSFRYWTAVAVSRDTRNPQLWTTLGNVDAELSDFRLARAEYLQALRCDAWFTEALQGLGDIAVRQRLWSKAVHWYRLAVATAAASPTVELRLRGGLRVAQQHLDLLAG